MKDQVSAQTVIILVIPAPTGIVDMNAKAVSLHSVHVLQPADHRPVNGSTVQNVSQATMSMTLAIATGVIKLIVPAQHG